MKKSLFVDRGKLESAIRQAEQNGPLGNRGLLWKAIAELYNKNRGDAPEITFSVVLLRVGEWNLPLKTPRGKKGRSGMTTEQKVAQVKLMQAGRLSGEGRVSKAEKFAKDPAAKSALEDLKKTVPERYQPLVLKVIQGSRTAALKLKCLDCANWQPIEIKLCPVTDCALWNFRAFTKKAIVKDAAGNDTIDDSEEKEENSNESEE